MDNANTTTGNMLVSQQGSGDAWMNVGLTNGAHYALGVDNSDGDKLKIGYNTTQAGGVSENTRMTIDTAGKVGIGTTTPEATLHVNGSVRYSPVTSHISIGPFDLVPDVISYGYNYNSFSATHYLHKSDPSDQTWRAPVHLPHGCTITEVRLRYFDSLASFNFSFVQLVQVHLATETVSLVASLEPTGSASGIRVLTSPVTPFVINNHDRYQYLLVRFPDGLYPSYAGLGFAGFTITYTVDRPY
jgi:hypothetical protein